MVEHLFDRPAGSFITDITFKDLQRLRKITLNIWRKHNPMRPDPHPLVIDGMINELGARTAENLLRREVDAGNV